MKSYSVEIDNRHVDVNEGGNPDQAAAVVVVKETGEATSVDGKSYVWTNVINLWSLLDWESTHELARIDVKGDYAVAISRIEWAQNDTIKNVRVSGGWESLWFLRKVDGNWKFTSAVNGFLSWRDEEPQQ